MAASKKSKQTTKKRKPASNRSDKSVEAFRDAVERSVKISRENVTLSRDRLQDVFDDAVKRGRMTRKDANELISSLVTRGRSYTDDVIKDLEGLLDQARKEVDTRVAPARKRAEQAGKAVQARRERTSKAIREAAEPALAEADRLRVRAGVGAGNPITGYDSLSANQVKSRLKDMRKADLRKVRTQEKRGKARKGVLDAIEKQLSR